MPKYQPGIYLGEVHQWGLGESKNENKTPYLYVAFKVTHQAGGGEWLPADVSEERTVFLWLSEKALDRTLQIIGDMGFVGDDLSKLDLPGDKRQVQFECKEETYDNKVREKWEVYGNRSIEHKALEGNAVRALNAHWQKHKPSGRPTAAPPPPAQSNAVPF